MILNPFTAFRLAAEAERALEALATQPLLGGRSLDLKVRTVIARLQAARNAVGEEAEMLDRAHSAITLLGNERDAALAKIARMTGGLRQNAPKSSPHPLGAVDR